MATQGLYLVITDGTAEGTVTIGSGGGNRGKYWLAREGWVPGVAGLRESELGGRGPYEDALEELELNIEGETAGEAYSNLDVLNRLIDQADRWERGESVAAVLIKYSPRGATVSSIANPLQSAILGRPDGEPAAGVGLTPKLHLTGKTYFIEGVRVRFVRRGLWLHTENSASSSSTANSALATVAVGNAPNVVSPTRVEATNFVYSDVVTLGASPGFVAVVEASDQIAIVDAAGLGTFSDFTDQADAAKFANGSVRRFTPTATTERIDLSKTFAMSANTRRVAILASLRNNSSTTSFKIRIKVLNGGPFTNYVVIPAFVGSAKPDWIFLGLINMSQTPIAYVTYLTASAAAGSLDIDTLVFVDLTNVNNSIFAFLQDLPDGDGTTIFRHDHQLLSLPEPKLVLVRTPESPIGYKGDLMLHTKAATLYALLMGMGGAVGSARDTWRQNDAGAVTNNVWTIFRRNAYLTPV